MIASYAPPRTTVDRSPKMIRNRARLRGLVVQVAFDVGDRGGRVVVAFQDGGEHAEVVLRGPALVRFPVRVVGDDVGVVGPLAAAHHHVQRLGGGGVGDQAAGGGDGAALRGSARCRRSRVARWRSRTRRAAAVRGARR